MGGFHSVLIGCSLYLAFNLSADELRLSDAQPLRLPPVGSYQLRVLGPALLELTLVTTKPPAPAPVEQWAFIHQNGQCQLPDPKEFAVSAGGKLVPVKAVGFKRRVLYAPLKQRDLRIGNYLYLHLAAPVAENQVVEVRNPDKKLWPPAVQFTANSNPLRWSPVLHVNQTGYLPTSPKKAMVGYYLGSLGEMDLQENLATVMQPSPNPGERAGEERGKKTPEIQPASALRNSPAPSTNNQPSVIFQLLDIRSNKEVFRGTLTARPDRGFPFECYQRVLEADFTAFTTPGQYRLFIPGLGASYSFFIDDAVAGAFARTYALGLYHQRCGTNNALPFTRFIHGPCHTAPAEVPTLASKFAAANQALARESAGCKDNPRHTAPQLKNSRPVSTPSSIPGRWMFGAAITTPAITANTPSTAPRLFITWSLPPMPSRGARAWTTSACPRAATAKATCCRKRNGKPISSPKCRTPTAASTSWSIRATASTKTTSRPTTAIRRSSGQRHTVGDRRG